MSQALDSTRLRFASAAATPAEDLGQRLEQLNAIGASLSAERDINRLLESILVAAKTITRADGGTLYRVTEEKTLRFEIVRTSSLKYYLAGKRRLRRHHGLIGSAVLVELDRIERHWIAGRTA